VSSEPGAAHYRQTNAWTDLSLATRKQRENIMRQVLATGGDQPLSKITPRAIQQGIERRKSFAARHFLDTLRGMFKWAVGAEHIKSDPTAGKAVAKPKSKGFPEWTEEELDQYAAHWPLGTRERVMWGVFCFTGLRRGDAAKLGKQHIRNGVITIDTEKTDTRVTIPVLKELAEILAAGPLGELSIIASKKGQPMRKEVVGNLFKKACIAAGIHGKSAHGIRKAAATRAANNGATVATLEAIFGWEGGQMAALYTKTADRRRWPQSTWKNCPKPERLFPHLMGRCGAKLRKDNEIKCINLRWWGKKDSNLRSHKTADLQSAPFATRDTPPFNRIANPPANWRRMRPWMTLIP
jgi:integrase